jgi:hypothetical protein
VGISVPDGPMAEADQPASPAPKLKKRSLSDPAPPPHSSPTPPHPIKKVKSEQSTNSGKTKGPGMSFLNSKPIIQAVKNRYW